ncbi:3-oxoacyl-ACP reductase [Enterococcus florum]|uniref:3-oxoacyl-ACP reductase n=1 Tax=Enterococcus florum TaxID=2480627 RepID=A0A4P5P9T3_9ENTE|nr:SDR family NAD(P)-dependent oxidoreductase [Enterococcus florum]GCF94356.1 3-oxoacyl-ACP reductase [Enterococcus florum]
MNFENQTALITGGGRGLGFAYAEELARRGVHVLIQDSGVDLDGLGNDPIVVQKAVEKIRKTPNGSVHASTTTINTREGCQALIQEAIDIFGRLDILIHNAGWVSYQTITELTPEFLHRAMAVQTEAPIWLAQAVWPQMTQQEYGRIVFTTSCRAIYPEYAQPGLIAYAATKISQIGLMNVLAKESQGTGIEVNAVSPVARTRMWGVNREPLDLKPESIVPGVMYLASSECQASAWILRASNHHFHAIRWQEAAGVDYPIDIRGHYCKTAEEVAGKWSKIAVSVPEYRSN